MITELARFTPRYGNHANRRPLVHEWREHNAAVATGARNPDLEFLAAVAVGNLLGLSVQYVLLRQGKVRNGHRKLTLQNLVGLCRGARKCFEVSYALHELEHRRRV